MLQHREYRQLQRAFEDLRAWIDWGDMAARIYLHDQRICVRIERTYNKRESADGPLAYCVPRCVGAINEFSVGTPSAGRCIMWFTVAGRSLPRRLLSSVRIETGGLTMNPAAEWGCFLTHLCGSVALSRRLFEEYDLILTHPIEASVRAAKLLRQASGDCTAQAVSVARGDNLDGNIGKSVTSNEGGSGFDEFLSDIVRGLCAS